MSRCRDLRDIIGSIDLSEFMEKHWQRRPHVVERHDPDFYRDVFTLADVDTAVVAAKGGVFGTSDVQAVRSVDGRTTHTELRSTPDGRISLAAVHSAHADGHTIIVNHVNRTNRAVAGLCTSVESVLQHPVGCNFFLTPPDACGFVPHYDAMDTFFLQVSGTKRWQVWEPIDELPVGEGFDKPDPDTLGRPAVDVELAPGDVLYLPRGWIHHGTTGAEHSLHLTLGVRVTRWFELLEAIVRRAASDDLRLREAIPLWEAPGSEPAGVVEHARRLLAEVADTAQTDALAEVLDQRLQHRPSPLGSQISAIGDAQTVELDSVLVRRPGLAPVVTVSDTSSMLRFAGSHVQGPVEAEAAFRVAASAERFTPRSLPSMPEAARLELAKRLVIEGLFSVER